MSFLRRCLLFLCVCLGIGFSVMVWFASQPIQLRQATIEFTIPSGIGFHSASRLIAESGAAFSVTQFSLLARALGKTTEIKAGSYEVTQGITPLQLLAKLTRGDTSQSEVQLIEGKTLNQWRMVLDSHPDLRHDTKGLSERELLARLGINAAKGEGLFFPDTYLVAKQSSDLDVLKRAHHNFLKHLTNEWDQRTTGLPYRTPYEALIMASIIEKETGRAEDRPYIASVFVNRLRIGMLLQTDPSVIYGLGDHFDGNLRKTDLQADTPYNTYTRAGLPPTPIAMPSLASLKAALMPASEDKLYFVARGDGSSEFSRTLDEHNKAVARYQKRKKGTS